ncbi:TPA: TIGR02646 family protein [Acinetobacter baumannii]|uniref:TIGR02646 family protein n=1 Tax=Acinetobacter baumannii TaxID=470 RepID=UPI001EE850B6|nr:TIGR02646 family protein [Acinetobacter baumannii]MCG5908651.1 TIGR02646 family protein [Acinetobacter baumannii]MDH2664296.1 TIGR02646 family protein [Acinetobacter baumannii]MDR9548437.1 TIGR02646 family protein [Acinetobacter baumannii]HAV4493300.1 TIGR02646 family protein [Acinetobacter baumannii]HAV4507960.1 TIGR02646 family protein [Acinetobacter baumannii]
MLNIIRPHEPSSLTSYRQQPDAKYDGPLFTPVKSDIREALVISQGYLCAYCMQRISNDRSTTKIEHWQCQHTYSQRQLDFTNMFAVCQGTTQDQLHCDSSKGKQKITIDPASRSQLVESYIRYTNSGEIYVQDNDLLNNELNKILNLNHSRIKNNRQAVLKAVTTQLSKYRGTVSKSELQGLLSKWSSIDAENKKIPYSAVAIFYLKNKLLKAS